MIFWSSKTAIDVSSQEVSIPKIFIVLFTSLKLFKFASKFRVIQRVKKIFKRLAIALISIVITLFILFQFTFFQTFLGKAASAYLSRELNTEILLDKVKLNLFNSATIEGLYIEDQFEDTLLYAKSIEVGISKMSSVNPSYQFSLYLDSIRLKISREKGQSFSNLQFIIDYFTPESSSNDKSNPFIINQLEIVNSHLSYEDINSLELVDKFNFSHLNLYNFQFGSENLYFGEDKVSLDLFRLAYHTTDQFILENLRSQISIQEEQILLKDLKVKTPKSEIVAKVSFVTNSFESYANFIQDVYLAVDFEQSKIDLTDLAYFVPNFNKVDQQISLSGKVSGTVDNLSGENLKIGIDQFTHLNGEFDIRGLPEIEETFIYMNADELLTSYQGLSVFPFQMFDSSLQITVPEKVRDLGDIKFEGNFTGFLKDFVAYGTFYSNIGVLKTDLSLSSDQGKVNSLNGSISSKDLDVANFLGSEEIKSLGFQLEIHGENLSEEYVVVANGKVVNLNFRDYTYEDISLNGTISEGQFKGDFAISDTNLVLDFSGVIDTKGKRPTSEFILNVEKSNLDKLALVDVEDSLLQLSFRANCEIVGKSLDEMEGKLSMRKIKLMNSTSSFSNDTLGIVLIGEPENRKLNLQSTYVNANLAGEIYFSEMLNDWEGWFSNLFFTEKKDASQKKSNYNYQIDFVDFEPIQKSFIPNLSISPNSYVKGKFNGMATLVDLKIYSDEVAYGNFYLTGFNVKAEQIKDSSQLFIETALFKIGDLLTIGEFASDANFTKSKGYFTAEWLLDNDSSQFATLNANIPILKKDKIELEIQKSFFTVGDSTWNFENYNKSIWNPDSLIFQNLGLATKNQGIALNGVVSKNPEDSLILELKQLNLAYINQFFTKDKANIEGVINGNASFKNLYENPLIESNIGIKGLVLNDYEIEEASVTSFWNKIDKSIGFRAYLGEGIVKYINLEGKVFPFNKEKDALEVYLEFNHFPIGLTERYIEEYLTNLKGALNGKLRIKGDFDEPILEGVLSLDTAAFRVDYLNTSYTLNHEINIKPDYIGFDLMKIKDDQGVEAIATGTVFHNNFKDFNLDINLDMERFHVLNTNKKSNDLYYGNGIVSGNANINGYADQLNLELDLTTIKGTDISIPLSSEVEVSENDFLIFTNSPEVDEDTQKVVDLSGLGLKLNLEMNSGTKVKILFDESIGDKIFAEGKGNLEMSINPVGDFDMFGQFEVEKGEYTLTFKNLVNKKLEIVPGSKMMWDGNPYQARMDIKAIYNLRASPYALMPEDSSGRYNRRVPVELELQLGGLLLTPDIDFDIRMPTSDEFVKERLRSILYVNQSTVNEQELNQQVFGLLVLNRFMPPTTGDNSTSGGGSAGINNGYELLSNQLSSWLSSTSDAFDIGVAYRPANEVSDEEVDVSLTTEVFNERLVLDGNLGYTSDEQALQDNRQSNFVGEFMAEYKVSKDGRLRVRGFNRAANNDLIQVNSPYTQGVGISYREEFDKFSELKERRKKKKQEKKENKTAKRNDKGRD